MEITSGTWLTPIAAGRPPPPEPNEDWQTTILVSHLDHCRHHLLCGVLLNLAIFVRRYGYLDTVNPQVDADVIVWQIPLVPLGLALIWAVPNSFWLLASSLPGALARLGEAIRNPRLVLEFFRQISDGSSLARCLIWQASFFLPARYRARYQAEWMAELDCLRSQAQDRGYTRWALGVLCSAPWTGLVLRGQLWSRSLIWQQLCRLRPLWNGVATAFAVFSMIAVSFFPRDGESPNRKQALGATIAALLSGAVSGGFAWKEQRRNEKVVLDRD